ncbi:MAG: hypothetical protein ACOCZS_04495 [Verrucomicrobiota bacterium]
MIGPEEKLRKSYVVGAVLLVLPLYLWMLFFPVTGGLMAEAALAVQQLSGQTWHVMSDFFADLNLQHYPLNIYLSSVIIPGAEQFPHLALRLLPLLLVAALAVGCGVLAGRLFNRSSLPVAAAVVLAMPLMVYAGVNTPGHILFATLIGGAWFVVFYYGFTGNNWLHAWLIALLLVFVAAFEKGLLAYVYFYLPLLFLRRPIRAWHYLLKPMHLLMLFTTLALFALWFAEMAPEGFSLLEAGGKNLQGFMNDNNYLLRLIVFPIVSVLVLMPWPLFSWAAYCAAFKPLEKQPEVMHYVRTIVISIFILTWLMPPFAIAELVVIIPPFAVMTAAHYEILMRRYRRSYLLYAKIMFLFVTAVAFILYLVYFFDVYNIVAILPGWDISTLTIVIPPVLMLGGYLLIIRANKLAVWLQFTFAIAIFLFCYLSISGVLSSYRATFFKERSRQLVEQVPDDTVVYLLLTSVDPEYLYYLDRPLKRVENADAVPDDIDEVYALGRERPPIAETIDWQSISESIDIVDAQSWKLRFPIPGKSWLMLDTGVSDSDDEEGEEEEEGGGEAPVKVRMYQATEEEE